MKHVEKGVSMKDFSKTKRSLFSSLHIKPYGMMSSSGKKCSS